MKIVGFVQSNQRIAEDVTITGNSTFTLYGTVNGDVHVSPGGTAYIYGTVTGNMQIDYGGYAHISGVVDGTVYNNGGRVHIMGRVGQEVTSRGETAIDPHAVIRIR